MEIGLVSFSGLALQDDFVRQAAGSLPGLKGRIGALLELPNLGLLTIAALIPPKHNVSYIELLSAVDAEQLAGRFDLVAISSWSARIEEAYEISETLKRAGTKTVVGGQYASYFPDDVLQHCDAVSVGEGELHWHQIIRDAECGNLQRVYGSMTDQFDLQHAPVPRFDLLPENRRARIAMQMSRGCPHRCDFCAASVLMSPKYKHKPVTQIEREVDVVRELTRRPFIEFVDDNAFSDREKAKLTLQMLAKKSVRWFAECDLAIADDERLLDLLADSGCAELLIGLESPHAGRLQGVELHADWKYKTHKRQAAAIRKIQSRGIRVLGCFAIGWDGDEKGIAQSVIDRAHELELSDVQVTVLTPFPGTPLRARLEFENRINQSSPAACTLFDVAFTPANMSAEELRGELHHALNTLFSRESTVQRSQEFKARRRLQITGAAK